MALHFLQNQQLQNVSETDPLPVQDRTPFHAMTGYGFNPQYVSDTYEFDRFSLTINHVGTAEVNIDPAATVNDPTLTHALRFQRVLLCCDHNADVTIRVYGRLDDRNGTGWTRWALIHTFNLTGDSADLKAIITQEEHRAHDYRITAQVSSGTAVCKFVLRGTAG